MQNTAIIFRMSREKFLQLQQEKYITNNFNLKAKFIPNNKCIVTFIPRKDGI